MAANLGGMDRAEAEAIYDAGRDVCVQFILDLAAQVEQLEDRLRRLEEQARQDSRTSSKPPSQDPPKTRQQRRAEARAKAKELLAREGAERKAGGQQGHRGAGRKLGPEDQVDEIVDHYPDACRGCGREFGEDERRPGGRFGRHQVCELPPISVLLVEHRTQRLRCPGCRAEDHRRGCRPGSACSAFGPRLRAAIVTLTARNRISRRGASELAGELFGARLSTGSVDAICQRASDALAGPHSELRDWILGQDALHVDETGWRTAGDSRALWAATTPGASLFRDRRALQPRAVRRADRRASRGSSSPTAGPATSTSTPTGGRSAGRTSSATSAATAKDSPSRRPSASRASSSPAACSPPGAPTSTSTTTAPASRPTSRRSRHELARLLEDAGPRASAPAAPPVRQQPAQGLARAVDLHHPPRRRADQQPRRTRAARPGHPPKTLARHPHRRRRTVRRTRALRRRHLPPTTTLAVRLPHPTAHRPQPRRPAPRAHLTQGLNGY